MSAALPCRGPMIRSRDWSISTATMTTDADDDELPERLHVEHHEPGGQHGDDQRADDGAHDRCRRRRRG